MSAASASKGYVGGPAIFELDSFSVEALHTTHLKDGIAVSLKGHLSSSFTAQVGHRAVYLFDASQQLAQTLSLPSLLQRASDVYLSEDALQDIEAHPQSRINAIALQHEATDSECFLFAAIRSWIVVLCASTSVASSNSAYGTWRVIAVLNTPDESGKKDAIHRSTEYTNQDIYSISVDCNYLAVGTGKSISLWSRSSSSGYRWRCFWRMKTPRPVAAVRLCPGQEVLAAYLREGKDVLLWRLVKSNGISALPPRPKRLCAIRHSRPIKDMIWRGDSGDTGTSGPALLTRSSDGVSRLWTPFIDEPDSMRLIAAIDGCGTETASLLAPMQMVSDDFTYLDAKAFAATLRLNLSQLHREIQVAELRIHEHGLSEDEIEMKRAQSVRLETILLETPDVFVRTTRDGALEVRAIANLDRKPPTLCGNHTLVRLSEMPRLGDEAILMPYVSRTKQRSDEPVGTLILRNSDSTTKRAALCPATLLASSRRGLVISDAVQKKDVSLTRAKHAHDASSGSPMPTVATIFREGDSEVVKLSRREATPISNRVEAVFRPDMAAIVGVAWSKSTSNSATPSLAVAGPHVVYILHRQRRTSTNLDLCYHGNSDRLGPWKLIAKLEAGHLAPDPIIGLAWLDDGRLELSTQRQTLVFSPRFVSSSRDQYEKTVRRSPMHVTMQDDAFFADSDSDALFELLRWNCFDVVHRILSKMRYPTDLQFSEDVIAPSDIKLDLAFRTDTVSVGDDDAASNLDEPSQSGQETHDFTAIVSIASQVRAQSHLLDSNAVRYFVEQQFIAERIPSVKSNDSRLPWHLVHHCGHFIWAWLSDTQTQLVQNVRRWNNNRLDWHAARRAGIFLWHRDHEVLATIGDDVARAQYNSGDERDPTFCSLFYLAMNNMRIVTSLWRQAIWHPDQKKMVQFLKNDFNEPRWKSAAAKNAFALLSQRRFEMAASFFLLGDQLSDAVNVCVRNLRDVHLAIALCRLREGRDDGPVLRKLLLEVVGPDAYRQEDRHLLSWVFMVIQRPDLALRSLCSPLEGLASDLQPLGFAKIEEPADCAELLQSRDAQFALLYKVIAIQAGPEAVCHCPPDAEFRLVRYACDVLMGSGHGKLAIAVARDWRFSHPVSPTSKRALSPSALHHPAAPTESTEASPKKIASLMKSASSSEGTRQPVQQEAAFDLGAFDF